MLVNMLMVGVMDDVTLTLSRLERMWACMEDGMEDDAVVDCGAVAHLDSELYLLLNYGHSIHIVCDCNCCCSIHYLVVVDVVPLGEEVAVHILVVAVVEAEVDPSCEEVVGPSHEEAEGPYQEVHTDHLQDVGPSHQEVHNVHPQFVGRLDNTMSSVLERMSACTQSMARLLLPQLVAAAAKAGPSYQEVHTVHLEKVPMAVALAMIQLHRQVQVSHHTAS